MVTVKSSHEFDYRGIWKLLIDRDLSRKQLQEGTGLSNNVMSRLAKSEGVSLETLARICSFLQCTLSDLNVEVKSDRDPV